MFEFLKERRQMDTTHDLVGRVAIQRNINVGRDVETVGSLREVANFAMRLGVDQKESSLDDRGNPRGSPSSGHALP